MLKTSFTVDSISGLLRGAQQRETPNQDERPGDSGISLLVIHNISLPPGEFGGPWIDKLFTNTLAADAHPYFNDIAALEVSAHLLIERDGTVAQYVSFLKRAWHAGASCFDGCERCNDYSIGIELEGADEVPYTDAQYAALASVAEGILHTYPDITPGRIVGHSDVAPGRKTDPGPAFDWARFRTLLGDS